MKKEDILTLLPPKQKGKLNIFFWVSENSGVGYYRQYLPAIKLRQHNLAQVLISDFKWGEGDHEPVLIDKLYALMVWADIVVVGRLDQGQFYSQWGAIREYFNIPIIMDTDDNVNFVRPMNPGYEGYHPNAESVLWNKQAIGKVFDAVTVTTQDLKDFYHKLNPRIYILPNNLDVEEWKKYEKPNWNDDVIRIGFIGSAAHAEGIQIIKKPLLEAMQKYQHIKFYVTHIYRKQFDDYPKEIKARIEFVPWFKLEQWPKFLKELGLDIGLAPLADNMFNRAKSNLRWMEYSLSLMAAIASPVKPYLCIKDKKTGILAKEKEDWFNAIELLTLNKEFRYNITKEAQNEIIREYNIDKNINQWLLVYQEVHDKFHQYFGEKKKFESLGKGKYKLIN